MQLLHEEKKILSSLFLFCLRESPGFQVNLIIKRLILDTTLTYYCLNVWFQMYFSIISEPHFECNKNLGRSYTCKVLGFLYQLVSKICIKSRKNSRKISGKAWVGEGACNQTENLVFTIRNREIEKLNLSTCRPRTYLVSYVTSQIQSTHEVVINQLNTDKSSIKIQY